MFSSRYLTGLLILFLMLSLQTLDFVDCMNRARAGDNPDWFTRQGVIVALFLTASLVWAKFIAPIERKQMDNLTTQQAGNEKREVEAPAGSAGNMVIWNVETDEKKEKPEVVEDDVEFTLPNWFGRQ